MHSSLKLYLLIATHRDLQDLTLAVTDNQSIGILTVPTFSHSQFDEVGVFTQSTTLDFNGFRFGFSFQQLSVSDTTSSFTRRP